MWRSEHALHMNPGERVSLSLVAGMGVLVALDAAGGLIAIATNVNTTVDAWSSQARLAAPWAMILFQVVMTALAVRAARRVAVGAAALLAAACFISSISGFFDGGLAAPGLKLGHVAFQILLIGWTAFVGSLAMLRVTTLLTRGHAPG